MINVLVTGADGQLGMCIQKIAGKYPGIQWHFKDSKALDITEKQQINEAFELLNIDYCINTAAFTNVEAAEKSPEKAFLVNARGTGNIAEAAKKQGVTLIHISTDYVFDGEKKALI